MSIPTLVLRLGMLLTSAAVLGGLAAPARADASWSLGGEVTVGGLPSAGVEVSVFASGTTTDPVAEAVTGEDGTYSLSAPEGTWDVAFTPLPPQLPVTQSVALDRDRTLNVALVLSGDTVPPGPQPVVQQPVSRVLGRVLDAQGVPAAGVTVRFTGSSASRYQPAGADGRFSIFLTVGHYQLQVSRQTAGGDLPGAWMLTTAPAALTIGSTGATTTSTTPTGGSPMASAAASPSPSPTTVTLTRTTTTNGPPVTTTTTPPPVVADTDLGDVRLPEPARVGVQVLDPAGAPVLGASVTARTTALRAGFATLAGLPIQAGSASSVGNSDGEGVVTGLPVWPSPAATAAANGPGDPQLWSGTSDPFDSVLDGWATVRLRRADVWTGRLVTSAGIPVGSAQVGMAGPGSASILTAADGTFRLYLQDGTYRFTVRRTLAGRADLPSSWELATDQAIAVQGDRDVGDVALPPLAHLDVTVLGEQGSPVPGARVTAHGSSVPRGFASLLGVPIVSGDSSASARVTDEQGVAHGVDLWPDDAATVTVTPQAADPRLLPTTAVVPVGRDTAATVQLPLASRLSGRVVGSDGTPVPGATVQLINGFVRPGTTGPDGAFSVYAAAGSYQLSVGGTGGAGLPSGPWQLATDTSALQLPADRVLGDLSLPATVRLGVTVLAPGAQPLPGSQVSAGTHGLATPSTLAGLPVSFALAGASAVTNAAGATSPLLLWASPSATVRVVPTGDPRWLPVSTPPINLTASADLLVAYQPNGSVSLINAVPDSYPATAGAPLDVPAPGVKANDRAFDGRQLQALLETPPVHGTVALDPSGAFRYTPADGFFGTDRFTYRAVAGDLRSQPVTVTLDVQDRTPPVLGTPIWSGNPKILGTAQAPVTATVTVPAGDAHSGIRGGEYAVDTDPGPGSGIPTAVSGDALTATFGAGLPVGVHDVFVRAQDNAGNWSLPTRTMLVVYDSTGPGITGKNKKDLVPSLAAGDQLPGLTTQGQTDTADYGFTVGYRGSTVDPRSDFHLTYLTGRQCTTPHPSGCHSFALDATSFDWLVMDGSGPSRGRFQGRATVTADGATTSNPFTVTAVDGDRTTPATEDAVTVRVYPPDTDPTTATPQYQVSGSLPRGNAVEVR